LGFISYSNITKLLPFCGVLFWRFKRETHIKKNIYQETLSVLSIFASFTFLQFEKEKDNITRPILIDGIEDLRDESLVASKRLKVSDMQKKLVVNCDYHNIMNCKDPGYSHGNR